MNSDAIKLLQEVRDYIVEDSLYFQPPENLIPRMDELLAQGACLEERLPDGRVKVLQENSLLRSQLANCNAEIKRLRLALLSQDGVEQ